MSRAKNITIKVLLVVGILFSIPSLLGSLMLFEALFRRAPVDGDSGMAAFMLFFLTAPVATVALFIHLMMSPDGERKLGLWVLGSLYGCPIISAMIYYFLIRIRTQTI